MLLPGPSGVQLYTECSSLPPRGPGDDRTLCSDNVQPPMMFILDSRHQKEPPPLSPAVLSFHPSLIVLPSKHSSLEPKSF